MPRVVFGLRARLFLLILIAIVPVVAITLLTAFQERNLAQVEAQQEALRVSRVISGNQARWIEGTRQILVTLAQLPVVRTHDAEGCSRFFADLHRQFPAYSSFSAIEPDGDMFCSAVPLPQALNLSDRNWFQRVTETQDFIVDEYVISRVTGTPVVVMAYPVIGEDGEVIAYVSTGLELHWLNQVIAQVELPDSSTLTVFDRNGTIIARQPDPEKWVGRSFADSTLVQKILSTGEEGTHIGEGFDRVTRLYGFSPMGGDAQAIAYVSVGIPRSLAFAKADGIARRNLLGLGGATIIALIAAAMGGQSFVLRPVRAILGATRRLADGELHARTGLEGYGGELGELADAFDHMAASLELRVKEREAAEAALRDSTDSLRAIVESSPLSIISFNKDGTLTSWNEAAEQLGWLEEEVLGRSIPFDNPEMRRHFHEIFERIKHGERITGLDIKGFRRNGLPVDLGIFGAPLHDADGSVRGGMVIFRDISGRKQAEQVISESEARYRAVVEQSSECIYLLDVETKRFVDANPATAAFLGYSPDELRNRLIYDFVDAAPEVVDRGINLTVSQGGARVAERRYRRKDGAIVDAELAINVITYQGRRVLCVVAHDISERKKADEALRQSEQRFRSLVQHLSDIIVVLDKGGLITYISPSVERVTGYPMEEFLGSNLLDFGPSHVHENDVPQLREFLERSTRTEGDTHSEEFRVRHRDGSWRYIRPIATNLLRDPSVSGIIISARDITERVIFQEQLERQAFHDDLTGLPNRALFMDRLEHAWENSVRSTRPIAVIFLDLDRFKVINDTLGHSTGDQLLAAVAQRLMGCLRSSDTLARFGGDEFTVLVENISPDYDAQIVAERILDCLRGPFTLDGRTVFTSASIGIAVSAPGSGPDDLLRQADIALYSAKAQGRACFAVYDAGRRALSLDRLDLETDLRHAIERNELRLFYQPEVNVQTGEIVGFEALVRWMHPQRGLMPPGDFLPLAEEAGLILTIDHWVLNEACRQASVWRQKYPDRAPLKMSVNFSAREFQQPDLVESVAGVLESSGLEPDGLTVEITESVLMDDAPSTIYLLRALHGLGVRLAIDDFGTGYSSLSYLRRFAVDTLKIDQSFVRDIATDGSVRSIVQAITALAHALDIEVTAEGIETTEHLTMIRNAGCDRAQGYYFSRPLPSEKIESLLDTGVAPFPSRKVTGP